MQDATTPAAGTPSGVTRLPGGPVPLTLRQSTVAAVLILLVGLGAALLAPFAAALEARRVTPPGSVTAGQAIVLPADGWVVQTQDTDAVLLTRGGARLIVQWQPGTPPEPQTALATLGAATQQEVPGARGFGGVRQFTTPSRDPGYLEAFAAPGTTGAIAVVQASFGQAAIQAIAPSTTFSQVSDDIVTMITGLRILRRAVS